MERGDKVISPKVAGFYDADFGHQLIIEMTIERTFE
jgi:hypothetical protein